MKQDPADGAPGPAAGPAAGGGISSGGPSSAGVSSAGVSSGGASSGGVSSGGVSGCLNRSRTSVVTGLRPGLLAAWARAASASLSCSTAWTLAFAASDGSLSVAVTRPANFATNAAE